MANGFKVLQGIDSQMEHIPAGSVVSRRLVSNKQVKVTLLGFAPEQKLAEPAPGGAALLEVQRGNGVVFVGDEAHDLKPGSLVYIKPRTPHRLEASSEMVVLVTEIEK